MKWVQTSIGMLALVWLTGCRSCQEGPLASQEPVERDVILATTTSTFDTGLLDVLVPDFEERTGYRVKPIAVGSGQAMAMGRLGEADVLLVHSPGDEKAFVAEGAGINRQRVMYNDFVIVGPAGDPAGIRGQKSASSALLSIAGQGTVFVSRSDDSGTHTKEVSLWKASGVDPVGMDWYTETGLGMGLTLNVASEKGGYTLTDRSTFLALEKTLHLDVLVEGDEALFNVYHVIEVNPGKYPDVNSAGGKSFASYLVSPECQEIIRTFGIEKYGTALFHPDAGNVD